MILFLMVELHFLAFFQCMVLRLQNPTDISILFKFSIAVIPNELFAGSLERLVHPRADEDGVEMDHDPFQHYRDSKDLGKPKLSLHGLVNHNGVQQIP